MGFRKLSTMRYTLLALALLVSFVSAGSFQYCEQCYSNNTAAACGAGDEKCVDIDFDSCMTSDPTVGVCDGSKGNLTAQSVKFTEDGDTVSKTKYQGTTCNGTQVSQINGTCGADCAAGITYDCGSPVWIWVVVIIIVIVVILAIVGAIGGFLFWKKKKSQTSYVYDD